VRGIMLGGILALGAIGLSLIFGVLRIPNFAHGDMMTAGAYLALLALAFLPRANRSVRSRSATSCSSPWSSPCRWSVWLGYALDRLVFRRLRAQRSPSGDPGDGGAGQRVLAAEPDLRLLGRRLRLLLHRPRATRRSSSSPASACAPTSCSSSGSPSP
jgi:hypothetical protein